ncbi:MAG: ankyrin repeat domain-containing protein [Steroidobacteraceae bacterium]|nr:ankyrin repeat domain-containing protein [Steroidobacteraceae bacterium]
MIDDDFRKLIEAGDADALRAALGQDPARANQTIRWYLNQWNESDPLHFICDCVGNGWLASGREGEIAALLIEHGAAIDGSAGRESPLIAAASLGAEKVATVLIDAGADLERTGLFGARALHWAAWTGEAGIVRRLLARKVEIEPRCSEFGATPLFWAVHGYGPRGPATKKAQVEAARLLIESGAVVDTANKQGLSARSLAREGRRSDMSGLLERVS